MGGTRYHLQKVDEPPPTLDRRSRPSKLQKILSLIRDKHAGAGWFLVATYTHDEGAAAAAKRLRDKEEKEGHPIDWEWEARKFEDADGKVRSRLYVRVG